MKSVRLQTPSDTGRFSNFIPALLRLYGDDLWSQPGTGLPSIQDFQLFDSMMISAVSDHPQKTLAYFALVLIFRFAAFAYENIWGQSAYAASRVTPYVLYMGHAYSPISSLS